MTILERLSDSPDGRECRRCGASLEGAEVVGRVCLRCPECRYVTAFPPSSTTRLPLAYWAEQVPGTAPLLEDEPDPTRAAHVVGELIDTTLAFLAHWVDRSPGSAVHWLTTLLSRADDLSREGGEEASRDRSRPYRIAQLMYALILRHGPMDFGWSRSDEVTDYLNENGYALVSDLTILIDTLTRARRELNSMTVTGGELALARSQEDWELVELVNNIASERSARKTVLARSELHDLQRRLFGTSFDEIF